MSHALAPSNSIVPDSQPELESAWLNYFSIEAAIKKVMAHVRALPSSQTPEQHTFKAYSTGLQYFLDWSAAQLPTEDMLTEYIAHLKARGLSSATIGAKYLAPVRHLLRALANQRITGFTGTQRDFIADCRDGIRSALTVKTPRKETTSNTPALWREGHRLNLRQVNSVLRQCDNSPQGVRDYALLLTAFESALRLSELARITLNDITPDGDLFIITVRGKRNNIDPVPVSAACVAAIQNYVRLFNDGLDTDDPRRIQEDTPVWQPLTRSGNHMDAQYYNPTRGLSHNALSNIISKRSESATGIALAPHDTRRTAAAVAYEAGMGITDIQGLLRHKSAAVTMHYVGQKPDHKSRSLSNYVNLG